jgi:hypothetical protein
MKTRIVLLVLFLLALVATACQQQPSNIPPDPLEAVKKIADTQKDIKTQHIDLRLDLGIKAQGLPADNPAANFLKDFKANLTANGDVDNVKQDFDLKGALDLGQLNAILTMQGIDKPEGEFVKVGDKLYTKIADQDWQTTDVKMPTSSDSSASGQSQQFNPAQLAELLKKAGKAEKLADETIDNVGTYHFKVTINPIDLLTQLSQMAEASGGTKVDQTQLAQAQQYLKDSVVEVELWVGKEDLFIRQEKIHFALNLKDLPELQGATVAVDLLVAANTSKINQPVTIAAPK